jgi:signal transduction histidine kinase
MQHPTAFLTSTATPEGTGHALAAEAYSSAAGGSATELAAPTSIAGALRSAMTATGHDLMQPLQIISHALERLDVAEQQAGDRIWIEAARSQVLRLARGLADLVQAAVSQEPAQLPALQCLGAIMEETEAAWAKSAVAGGVQLEIVRVPVRIRTDRIRMRSILDNLIGNALKYGRHHVGVNTRLAAGKVHVDVVNDGEAIPPAVQARLFEAFYQADRTSDGLGLGLSIVREHCLALGHLVEVASEPSRTRFSVVIDAVD